MGWATNYIGQLQLGETVRFRPRGASMSGIIESGDLVEVMPLDRDPRTGDVVLCKVHGNQFLHLVRAVQGDRVQIGNNKGHINGWAPRTQVFGRVSAINPKA